MSSHLHARSLVLSYQKVVGNTGAIDELLLPVVRPEEVLPSDQHVRITSVACDINYNWLIDYAYNLGASSPTIKDPPAVFTFWIKFMRPEQALSEETTNTVGLTGAGGIGNSIKYPFLRGTIMPVNAQCPRGNVPIVMAQSSDTTEHRFYTLSVTLFVELGG